MRLLLRYHRKNADVTDLALDVDGEISVGELAAEIARADPTGGSPSNLTIRVEGPDRQAVLAPGLSARSGSLRSGQAISLVERSSHIDEIGDLGRTVATAIVIGGPDAGREFRLHVGANQIGRGAGNEIPLSDPMVSRSHAIISVGAIAEVVDLGSTNGVEVNGARADRLAVRSEDVIQVGDTTLRIDHRASASDVARVAAEPTTPFIRPPYVHRPFDPVEIEAPTPPSPVRAQRFPVFMLLMPLLMGGVLFLVTRQWESILFVLLTPFMLMGSFIEGRRSSKREQAEAEAYFHEELRRVGEEAAAALAADAVERIASAPVVHECLGFAPALSPNLWMYRPDRPRFLSIRFGIGTVPSRVSIKVASSGDRRMLAEARVLADQFRMVTGVPVTGDLISEGALGIGGHRGMSVAAARAALSQIAALHSPSDIVIAALASSDTAADWDWLKWLPHVGSAFSPIAGEHLAISEAECIRLVEELERLVEERASNDQRAPAIVVLIEEGMPVAPSRVVPLLERGASVGIHGVWVASAPERIPAACRAFVAISPSGDAKVGLVNDELETVVDQLEIISVEQAELFARQLSSVVDANAAAAAVVDLPASVSYLAMAGVGLADQTAAVIDRWRESSSIRAQLPVKQGRTKSPHTLRALVGSASTQAMVLDLRTEGPHALVAGTTGAGKSEFLQTWVLSMALSHSPERVTFLLVDYKGGAAFSLCDKLPHTVGLVTDLSPHLVRRAMRSLRAELHYRERLLERKKCKDLLDLESRNDPETPPSLVIVVDEFAALSKEVPEFVDGVVNVAQRGRSLGLHLILATQRPAGVITDNIRANTNLRVSLRVADTQDSDDVVGVPTAGHFDPSIPGRGLAKTGPSRIIPFQTGYVGGWTTAARQGPTVTVHELAFGRTRRWDPREGASRALPEVRVDDPTDIQRMVANIRAAATEVAIAPPRPPWLPDLKNAYDIFRYRSPSDGRVTIGVLDDPDHQRQSSATLDFEHDGSVAIYGASGSGKSTLLRTIAASAALAESGGPVHIYGLDFGGRGLESLEVLPCVGSVVAADDTDRGCRLIRMLRATFDKRSAQFAAEKTAGLGEFRAKTGQNLPRIIVLLDNFSGFNQVYDVGTLRWAYEDVLRLVGEGRPMGIHFVLSADRRVSMSPHEVSVTRRVVLRLTDPDEYAYLDAPTDVLGRESPAGRAILGDFVVQVGVPREQLTVAGQSGVFAELAKYLSSDRPAWTAPPVPTFPASVRLSVLEPRSVGGCTIGYADDGRGGIEAVGLGVDSNFVIVGPRGSGRSTALGTVAAACRVGRPGTPQYLVMGAASPLSGEPHWRASAVGDDDATVLLGKVADDIDADLSATAVIVIDDANILVGGMAEGQVDRLVRSSRDGRVILLVGAETSRVNDSYSSFLKRLRQDQRGIVLQSDPSDPDLFGLPIPRTPRSAQPPGRGFLVSPSGVSPLHVAF